MTKDQQRPLEHVAIIGGSVAGLLTAAALADDVEHITIFEHRPLPDPAETASIAPQAAFPHLLLAAGAAAGDRLLPGLVDDLFENGALGRRPRHGYWWAAGAVRESVPDLGVDVPFCSRALLESRLRARVTDLPNVSVVEGALVRGVTTTDGWVTGVRCEHGDDTTIRLADLVVDASGRSSRSTAWLAQAGMEGPPTSTVEVGVTYTAVDVRRHASDLGGGLFAVVQNTPELARIGVALPAEGDRWKVLLGGYFGDSAAPTAAGMQQFAASLPDPVISRLLSNEWLTEPAQHRFPSSRRRHFEKARRLPAGLCVIGDAVASFNPLYGQGMSSAALQAEALQRCVHQHGNGPALPRAVAAATAKVVSNPWQIATGADFIYPQTTGPKPPGTDAINRYLALAMRAAATDEHVNLALYRVQHMLAAPPSLLSPRIFRRVRRHRRRPAHRAAVGAGTDAGAAV